MDFCFADDCRQLQCVHIFIRREIDKRVSFKFREKDALTQFNEQASHHPEKNQLIMMWTMWSKMNW